MGHTSTGEGISKCRPGYKGQETIAKYFRNSRRAIEQFKRAKARKKSPTQRAELKRYIRNTEENRKRIDRRH